MPSSSAIAVAWSGPAPPNASSASARGSTPRSTVITRSARTISALATRRIPSAVSSSGSPSSSASRCTAARAASASSAIAPASGASLPSSPSTTLASVTVGSVPPCPYAAGPGRAPAECGPTRSAPPASRQAIEPPPAPTVWRSSIGSATGRPPTGRAPVSRAAPSSITQTSHDVPPMSKQSASGSPDASAAHAAPAAPPAGPDKTVRAACARAWSSVASPPEDCITSGTGSCAPRARSASAAR